LAQSNKKKNSNKKKVVSEKTFEEHISDVELIIDELNGKELSLEDSVESYKKAVFSIESAKKILTRAEKEIEVVEKNFRLKNKE
jgi:exodeoxyribonuclease VII small subunit